MSETIFALASGSYHAGVAVIRVSGDKAVHVFKALAKADIPIPRMAVLTQLREGNVLLDKALALYFKAPASFTGEDVVEFHLHGGRAVIDGVLAAIGRMQNCRMAEPGEFTRRAFENGKLDLTEAEAIADLIAAETEAQRLQALDQLGGGLSRLYGGFADSLIKILAHQEAEIEFPDEDMPDGISDGLKPEIEILKEKIEEHLNDNRRGERMRDGVRIAILGAPNAGKSSLLNILAARDVAIVSTQAGTTRDVVEVHLNLGGYPVILSDTAGLRNTSDDVEKEGIRRAKAEAKKSDIKILLFDGTQAIKDSETEILIDEDSIVVFSKADMASGASGEGLRISSTVGTGVDDLLSALTKKTANCFKSNGTGTALTRARHRQSLEEVLACLIRCLAADLPELAAEDLRMALRALGRITGRVHVEEILDKVFRDFCIGK